MREDCFAWRDRRCAALIVKRCEGCNFYKPYEQHIKEINAIEDKKKSREYEDMVAFINRNKQKAEKRADNLTGVNMGQRLKEYRMKEGLTQKEMAQKCGYVGQSAAYRLEQCDYITGKVRKNIIEKLGLEEDFFTREEK